MLTVRAKRERLDPKHGGKIERRVEMREQRAAARWLPFQGRPEPFGIERDKNKIAVPGEMRGERSRKLMADREVDEAVAGIVGRAMETSRSPGRFEGGLAQDFIDRLCHGSGGD